MDKSAGEYELQLVKKYIAASEDNETLEKLYLALKPLMTKYMRPYINEIPYLDKEDYFQIGYLTLWDVLERAKTKPDIVDGFISYYCVSVRNAYIKEFREYVLKNDTLTACYEKQDEGLTIYKLNSYEKYRQKRRDYAKRYRQENRDRIRERNREYREKNREKILERQRESRARNRDKYNEYQRNYYRNLSAEGKEKKRTYDKEWAKKNAEYLKQKKHEYYMAHREKWLEYDRQYRSEHREEIRERHKKYRKKKKDDDELI